jgi:hypothetical protein
MCNRRFTHLRNLRSHLSLFHGNGERAYLYCGIDNCNRVCSTSESFRKHIERFHSSLLRDSMIGGSEILSIVSEDHMQPTENANEMEWEAELNDSNSVPATELSNEEFRHLMLWRFLQFALKAREEYILPKSAFNSVMNDISELFALS